ncbi:hypothetical protein ACFVT2_21835 [Streptomyces sp. NPDC058000]|uniref:hypothetical protein n=1 Tax=Streptomyces sp. NPDC058000 TaxID=3346299 RepID=UPI0036F0FDCB
MSLYTARSRRERGSASGHLKAGPLTPGESARVAHALLTDFGIAAHEADTRMTATGMVIGSAAYMAPERIDGTHDGPAGDLLLPRRHPLRGGYGHVPVRS